MIAPLGRLGTCNSVAFAFFYERFLFFRAKMRSKGRAPFDDFADLEEEFLLASG